MSCLTHQIDALRWYGGEVQSVTSMSKVEPGRMEGESIGAVIAKMVTGTKGEAYFMSGKGTFVKLHGGKSEYFEYDMRAKEGFKKVETNKQISGHQSCIDE